jgi:hypothetical protein|tara:strand:+ start:6040 stop:6840 length:801 start_codon:yes stop_codon:yes gene_type:complete
MNQHLVIDTPFAADSKITHRTKKYVTCLQMVHCILSREVSKDISLDLFNQIGIVAGFIDQHLDELNIEQQHTLLALYDGLFEKIWAIDNYLVFKNEICQFVEQEKFIFTCEAVHLKDLFLFIQHCKTEGIKPDLKSFGKAIITIAIAKQEANKSGTLIDLLLKEGAAVIGLLRALLQTKYGQLETFNATLSLLQYFEHVLNVADDTLDTPSDKSINLISDALGPFHRLKMFKHLLSHMLKIIGKYPTKTAYYGPRLTWYYFSKTLR